MFRYSGISDDFKPGRYSKEINSMKGVTNNGGKVFLNDDINKEISKYLGGKKKNKTRKTRKSKKGTKKHRK